MIGTTIGPYRLLRQLGKGGMGEVYEGVDEKLGRHVAIKVLLERYAADPEIIARFFNEARSVNLIGHPGLVQVFEFGQLPTGAAFLVMEFLEGVTLSQRIKEASRVGEVHVLQIGLQLASALAAAHAKDIIHRDIKPSNVMLLQDSAMPTKERVKLLDFGIAKLGSQSAREEQPRTRTGVAIGTPAYMSPEQCRGDKRLDGKADVYSLGVILYQMLAGRLPFDAEGEGAILGMHLYEEPPRLTKIAPLVSRPVASLVHRMLCKAAHDRPTAKEVEDILSEMAAAALPSVVRESAKLATIARKPRSDGIDVLSLSSTLGSGVGQLSSQRSRRIRMWLVSHYRTLSSRGRVALAVGSGLVAVLIIGGIALWPGERAAPKSSPDPAPAAPAASVVKWVLTSTPSGAQVVRSSDQKILGQTPWKQEQNTASETQQVVLRLDGYRDRVVILEQGRDVSRHEMLDPVPAQPPASSQRPKTGVRKSKVSNPVRPDDSGNSKRGQRGKKTRLID